MKTKFLAAALIVSCSLAGLASASVVVTIADVAGGVKFSWTGTIDTSNLISSGSFNNDGGIATNGALTFAPTVPFGAGIGEWFMGVVTGPIIGTSLYTTYPNSLTGDLFAMWAGSSFVMPTGYLSGTFISGSVVFTGPSIASLGISPGTNVFSITNSPSTITLSAVPEPSNCLLLGLGALGLLRRRMRV